MQNDSQPNDLATLYLRNRHLLVLTIVVLLIGGFAAITNLPRLEDPRITTRNATIITFLPGASAARIEALINEKIEDTLEEIDEIKKIESTARPNVSSIAIELQDDVTSEDNEEIFSKIRSRLQNVEGALPADASIPILDDNRGVTAYTLIFGISWNGFSETPMNMLNRIAFDLKDRMLNSGNTELVRVFGGVDEEITVTPDKGELAALNMNAKEIAQIIALSDSKTSAGQLRTQNHDLQIEIDGALSSVDRIARIPLLTGEQGTVLKLGDITEIEKGFEDPPKQYGYKDGNRIIYVGVRADENTRVDLWTEKALQTYDSFRDDYSEHIATEIIFEQNEYTTARLSDLLTNLVLGALVVISIVFFTMGWKSAIVVGSVLPLSAAGSLFAFNFFGQSIHQMSIFGMLIAIGLIIDSAIVMTDEVRKSIHNDGMGRMQAMRNSVHHLFIPLLASTFTTILGFMPIFLLPGNAGDFVGPIAVSVVLALIFSFFLAMTVIPALAANASGKLNETADDTWRWWRLGLQKPKLFDDYKNFTHYALQRPKFYALMAMVLPITGFVMMSTMKVEFFPAADRDMFEVKMFLPSDSSIANSVNQVQIADQTIKELKGVEQVHWLVGASTPSVYYNQIPRQDNNSAFAQGVITAKDVKTANELVGQVQVLLDKMVPNARPIVQKFAQGPPATAPVSFRILGPEIETLRELGEEVRSILHQNAEITHTIASVEGGQAKLWFKADEAEVNRAGLNLVTIANQFQSNLEGFVGGTILEDVEELPIRVRLNNNERNDMANVGNIQLINETSKKWIPAEALGALELRPEVAEITRYNGQRVNTVLAYITPNAKAVSVSAEVLERINNSIQVPPGYSIDVAGDSEQQGQAVAGLAIFAPVLVTLMAATLILAFRSVSLAGIVFLVAILSVGLGMLSLKISGYPLGFNPLIGSVGLAGVAINGTIVVLAAILSNPKAKAGDISQILEETYGCGRHMISTTLTTIGGFVPLLLFSGGTFWPPLSVIIAGGMGFSLLLTMFFTPLAYKIFSDMQSGRNQVRSLPEVQA